MVRLIRPFGTSAAIVMLALLLALSPTAVFAASPRLLGLDLLAPVGRPDSYSTPYQTELVVAAPGVLANDTDPDAYADGHTDAHADADTDAEADIDPAAAPDPDAHPAAAPDPDADPPSAPDPDSDPAATADPDRDADPPAPPDHHAQSDAGHAVARGRHAVTGGEPRSIRRPGSDVRAVQRPRLVLGSERSAGRWWCRDGRRTGGTGWPRPSADAAAAVTAGRPGLLRVVR